MDRVNVSGHKGRGEGGGVRENQPGAQNRTKTTGRFAGLAGQKSNNIL